MLTKTIPLSSEKSDLAVKDKVSFTFKTEKTGFQNPPPPIINYERKTLTLARPVPPEFAISSPYGWRNIEGKDQFHNGVDFKTPVNTPVMAVESGSAFKVGWENPEDEKEGFGLRIWQEIELEGQRFYVWYAHLSRYLVGQGDRIKFGQLIAFTGHTGHSTGPHLHLGVRKKDTGDWWNINLA